MNNFGTGGSSIFLAGPGPQLHYEERFLERLNAFNNDVFPESGPGAGPPLPGGTATAPDNDGPLSSLKDDDDEPPPPGFKFEINKGFGK